MTSNLLSGYYLEHCWRVWRVLCGKEEFRGQVSIHVPNGTPEFRIPNKVSHRVGALINDGSSRSTHTIVWLWQLR